MENAGLLRKISPVGEQTLKGGVSMIYAYPTNISLVTKKNIKRKTELSAEMVARREFIASHKVSVKCDNGKIIAKVEKKN